MFFHYLKIFFLSLFILYSSVELCKAESGIIFDPGHTQKQYGTRSCSGGLEYIYNNELVDFIEKFFLDRNIKIIKTRTNLQNISLTGRTKFTSGKKLFVSVHHDSAQEKYITYKNGFPCSDYASGYSIFVSKKNPFFEKSLDYAIRLGTNLRKMGLIPSKHHSEKIKGENREIIDEYLGIYRFDDLVVLKTSKCPALLFEAAVIINPVDDFLSKTYDYKFKIALSMFNMI